MLAAVAARSTRIIARCITLLALCRCRFSMPACSACCPSPCPPPKASSSPSPSARVRPSPSASFRPCACACLAAAVRLRLSRRSALAVASSRACFSKKADLTCPWPSRTTPIALAIEANVSPMLKPTSSILALVLS